MPEMQFRLRWPDGSESLCYSPSLVVQEHVSEGADYALPDFLSRINDALHVASDRVQRKYGMPCSRAIAQLAQINGRAAAFAGDGMAVVRVLEFVT